MRKSELLGCMVRRTAAFEDAANVVINHAPWSWPHQGTSSQEIVTLNGTTHTPKPELCGGEGGGGAGVRASLPQNGCTALDVRGLQMFAPVKRLMNPRAAQQMRVQSGAEMKGAQLKWKKRWRKNPGC